MQAIDWVDCENNQATGAKPMSKMAVSINKPVTRPQLSTNPAREPLKQVKMYRLGKQIIAEISSPLATFTGAAQICAPIENVPTTIPYTRMDSKVTNNIRRMSRLAPGCLNWYIIRRC